MAGVQDNLAAEVARIVTCPYPTQLQTLRDNLERCTPFEIESWAVSEPHQTSQIVARVLAAIPHWPYCLDIVTHLARVVSIRDSLLHRDPHLLSRLIDQCLTSTDVHDQSMRAACSLLSAPLPPDFPIPATAQTLLVKLFDEAAAKPTSAGLHRLDILISTGCKPIISVLPLALLRKFESHVFKILREATDAEHQSLGLCCLSIMTTIMNAVGDRADCQGWDRTSMSSFFSGSRSAKTVQLTVLQTVWCCSDARIDSFDQVERSIASATNVLSAISDDVKMEWCRSNEKIMIKLYTKVMSEQIPKEIRLLIFSFITDLGPSSDMIPNAVTNALEELLLKIRDVRMSLPCFERVVERCLRSLLPSLSPRLLVKHLEFACRVIKSAHATAETSEVLRLTQLTHALVYSSQSLAKEQLAQVASQSGASLTEVASAIEAKLGRGADANGSTITAAVEALSRSLRILSLAIVVRGASVGLQWPPDIVELLFKSEMSHQSARVGARDLSNHGYQGSQEARFEMRKDLPWEDGLRSILAGRAHSDHNVFSAAIHQACEDLERRCQDVEAPLRAEQAKAAEAERRCLEMENAYSQLESELMNRDLHIADLETEVERQSTDLQHIRHERQEFIERVRAIESRLEETATNAQVQLQQLQAEHELKMLDLSSENARISEDLEREKSAGLTGFSKAEQLRARLEQIEEQAQRQSEHVDRLEEENGQLESRYEAQKQKMCTLQEQHSALLETQRLSRQDLDAQKAKSIEANNKSEDLLRSLRELREAYEKERADLLAEFRENASHARTEWESSRSELEQQIKTLERQLQESDNAADEATRLNEERNRHQKRQIAQLKKECATRDTQLKAAQEMRNKLMTAMGISAPAPPPETVVSTLPIRSASSTATPTARAYAQVEHETDLLDDSLSSALAEELEPTPKRPKGRVGFKLASQHPTSDGSLVRPANARVPLSETSVNISPTRRMPGKMVAFNDAQGSRRSEQDLRLVEGWSFSTDVVASTPAIGLGDEHVNEDVDDDTTVDL